MRRDIRWRGNDAFSSNHGGVLNGWVLLAWIYGRSHWICHGDILPHLNNLGLDPIQRIGAYINHIQNLLNA